MEDSKYWAKRPLKDKRRDWYEQGDNWVEDYIKSTNHSHRRMIMDALKKIKFGSLLELGCNAGPNLINVSEKYPEVRLAGIDINEDAIKRASLALPKANFWVSNIETIPFADKTFDVVLADAVLMYSDPTSIGKVLLEINRVTRKYIILCEWDAEEDCVVDGHWARDYKGILERLGYSVTKKKIGKKWKNKSGNWERNGYLYVATKN